MQNNIQFIELIEKFEEKLFKKYNFSPREEVGIRNCIRSLLLSQRTAIWKEVEIERERIRKNIEIRFGRSHVIDDILPALNDTLLAIKQVINK